QRLPPGAAAEGLPKSRSRTGGQDDRAFHPGKRRVAILESRHKDLGHRTRAIRCMGGRRLKRSAPWRVPPHGMKRAATGVEDTHGKLLMWGQPPRLSGRAKLDSVPERRPRIARRFNAGELF